LKIVNATFKPVVSNTFSVMVRFHLLAEICGPFNETNQYCYIQVVSTRKGCHALWAPRIMNVSWHVSRNKLRLLHNNRNAKEWNCV